MNVEDLNEYVNEDSVKGKLTRELLEILADFQNGRIDVEIKNKLIRSVEEGFHAEDAFADEQTSRYLKQAVKMLVGIV